MNDLFKKRWVATTQPTQLPSRQQLLDSIGSQLTDEELAKLERAIRNPMMKAAALRYLK